MKGRLTAVILALMMCLPCGAQDFDALKRSFSESFSASKKNFDNVFADAMRQSWKMVSGGDTLVRHERLDVPPVVADTTSVQRPEAPVLLPVAGVVVPPVPGPAPKPVRVKPSAPRASARPVLVSWCGSDFEIRRPEQTVTLPSADENSVADAWENISSGIFEPTLEDALHVREVLSMCDWAYYELTGAIASAVAEDNAAVVLRAYLLNHSGYRIRLARSGDECLHVLVSTRESVFGYPYWTMGGEKYYLCDGCTGTSLNVFDQSFDGENPLTLSIPGEVVLKKKMSAPVAKKGSEYGVPQTEVKINENLMEFYNGYPCFYEGDNQDSQFRFYASVPLSSDAKAQLYPILAESIKGKSETEAVGVLLNYVQTSFEYGYDSEIWGGQRSFYPDETLYYPYCDCEDRAIFFSRIVRDLTGLKVVLVSYPDHVAAAVNFTETPAGDYIVCLGRKYTVCDPTYIHAGIGMTMPRMNNSTATVLVL